MFTRKKIWCVTAWCLFCFIGTTVAPVSAYAQEEEFYVSGTADKITLELKGVDVIDVLKVLSKKSGLNIIAGKNVRGQVTLFLQNVDVREALKVVLETAELASEEELGIIKVITLRDYEAKYGKVFDDKRETYVTTIQHADVQGISQVLNELKTNIGKIIIDERTNTLTIIDLKESIAAMKDAIRSIDVPVEQRVFKLEYADVDEIEATITEMLTPATGFLKLDKRTNQIAVVDFPEKINQIAKIIQAFDEKPRQVLIEAKIVQVSLDDDYAFGIDWQLLMERTSRNNFGFDSNEFGGLSSYSTGPLKDKTLSTFTINSSTDDFYAVISALEGMGKTNTLSSPRIVVLNGEEAQLAVATQEPYVSQTVVQGDTTSTTADDIKFADVGVKLTVKPKITKNDMILLTIKPEVSSSAATPFTIDQFNSSGDKTGVRTQVPIVTTQEVETTILVENGKTLVIGGLIEDTEAKTLRKIPIIGDIPFFGKAFQNETIDFTKSELVIFLATQIIEDEDIFNKDYDRFLQKNGQLVEFDKFGDESYDFGKARTRSMNAFDSNNKPYWQDDREKKMTEQSKRVDTVAATAVDEAVAELLRDRMQRPDNTIAKIREGRVSDEGMQKTIFSQRERDSFTAHDVSVEVAPKSKEYIIYKNMLVGTITRGLLKRRELADLRGLTSVVLLTVLRDGTVDSIGFSRDGAFSQPYVRQVITEVVSDVSPFLPLPDSVTSDSEKFEVEISL